jgi:hypothetical protein
MHNYIARILIVLLMVATIVGCGGGGGGDGGGNGGVSEPTLGFGIKRLRFEWPRVNGATHYRLFENPDGVSGFTQVGGDLDDSARDADIDISVHWHDWNNARYRLESCDAITCVAMNEFDTLGQAAQAIGYVKPSVTDIADNFGSAVALSADGNTLAVGVWSEDSDSTGINGNKTNDRATDAGAVYVFTRAANGWIQQAYVKASDTHRHDFFGTAVALSADGNTLVVGAPGEDSDSSGVGGAKNNTRASNSGAVYVFRRFNNDWAEQSYIKASNTGAGDTFGESVALSADGNTLVVGARHEDSGAVGIGADQQNNALDDAGAAYVFVREGAIWSQQVYAKASNAGEDDRFGAAVAISADGNTFAVGAIGERSAEGGIGADQTDNSFERAGAVYVFTRIGIEWVQETYAKALSPGQEDRFGKSLSLSENGNTLAVGSDDDSANPATPSDTTALNAGAVHIFVRTGGIWEPQAYLKSSNIGAGDHFGSVGLSADGDTLAVGAYGEDSAAVAIDGDESSQSAIDSGAVYTFTRSGTIWTQIAYVKAPNTGAGDEFGTAVGLSANGGTLAVGAPGEAGGDGGIGADSTDSTLAGAGAAYLY